MVGQLEEALGAAQQRLRKTVARGDGLVGERGERIGAAEHRPGYADAVGRSQRGEQCLGVDGLLDKPRPVTAASASGVRPWRAARSRQEATMSSVGVCCLAGRVRSTMCSTSRGCAAADLGFELGQRVVDLGAALRELADDLLCDAVDLPTAGTAGSPPDPQPLGELVAHLGRGERGRGLCVRVQGPGPQAPVGPVFGAGGVDDHVVMVRERVERPGGEVPERRHREALRGDGLAVDATDRRVVFEPANRPVVPGLDRAEHSLPSGRVTEEGEHAEGLLGGERQVVGDAHRGWTAAFEELREMLAGHEPPASRIPVGDEKRTSGVTTRGEGSFDLVRVLLVVAGGTAQVLLRDADEPGRFRQGEMIIRGSECPDVVGFDPRVARSGAPFQLAGPHPPRPVLPDERDEVGARRLAEPAAEAVTGSRTGGPSGMSSGRSSGRSVRYWTASGKVEREVAVEVRTAPVGPTLCAMPATATAAPTSIMRSTSA